MSGLNKKSLLYDELKRMQSATIISSRPWTQRYVAMTSGITSGLPNRLREEAFVEYILQMRLEGSSYIKIASKLNHAGIGSPSGGRWYSASLYKYMRERCCEFLCQWPRPSQIA